MIYGSVCSGIEAASVAWEPLGWRPAFFSEIESFPRAVLSARFPSVPLHGDFTTIQPDDYEPINLLVGGTPCQSFSLAGLRGGLGDDRGNLALQFLRLADRLRPEWLVWENVPGVLSANEGRDFGSILGGLVELGFGFSYRVLDAQHFRSPQERRRVFVVGNSRDWRRAVAVLFERSSLSGDSPPSGEVGDSPTSGVDPRPSGRHEPIAFDGGAICPGIARGGRTMTLRASRPLCVHLNGRVRYMTPLECERLQGFPDGWTEIPGGGPRQRWKALGNSMSVPVMRWLGERIRLVGSLAES